MAPERKSPKVAVIGAGISGVVTAAYLSAAGVNVTVFERANVSGGVWVYDENSPIEPKYPAIKPSKGEEIGNFKAKKVDGFLELQHAPPSPAYNGLTNNVATRLMKTKLHDWPEGTEDYVNHRVLKDYIQGIAKKTGVEDSTVFGAKVTRVEKEGKIWSLTYETITRKALAEEKLIRKNKLNFDAVVIASGHYHAPRVPNILGLPEWKAKWPSRIWHSKAYRKPDGFEGKNVLLIGAGTSSTDIARELASFANKIYQSGRNGKFELPAKLLPPTGVRIGPIRSFDDIREEEPADGTFPGTITLETGEKLCNIHSIIICTGYHITLPFLAPYHEDETPLTEASDTVLVTDGTQIHNLHKDMWYIPDPSLIFVGVPYFTANFTLFEFQAIAVAAVLSGWADLPNEAEMRRQYQEKVKEMGFGKNFHSLLGKEVEYVNELLEWVNRDGERWSRPKWSGHTEEWHRAKEEQMQKFKTLLLGAGGIGGGVAPPLDYVLLPCS